MISEHLSSISSSQQIFEDAADMYNKALKKGSYEEKVKFITKEVKTPSRKRGKKWYDTTLHSTQQ